MIGIDMIPAQPPNNVSTVQGNFLSESVRQEVKRLLLDPFQGRPHEERPTKVTFDREAGAANNVDSSARENLASNRRALKGQDEDSYKECIVADGWEAETVDVVSLLNFPCFALIFAC